MTPLPVDGASSTVADACNKDGESGLDCMPVDADVIKIGAKADATLIMMEAAMMRALSDRTMLNNFQ